MAAARYVKVLLVPEPFEIWGRKWIWWFERGVGVKADGRRYAEEDIHTWKVDLGDEWQRISSKGSYIYVELIVDSPSLMTCAAARLY